MIDDKTGKPLDPTDDSAGLFGDTTGLTGITDGHGKKGTDVKPIKPENVSDEYFKNSLDRGSETEIVKTDKTTDIDQGREDLINSDPTGNETLEDVANRTPSVEGGQAVSGDMPDPASDDDALENAHDAGIALDEDEEHPKELNIAEDIDKAEEEIRSK